MTEKIYANPPPTHDDWIDSAGHPQRMARGARKSLTLKGWTFVGESPHHNAMLAGPDLDAAREAAQPEIDRRAAIARADAARKANRKR